MWGAEVGVAFTAASVVCYSIASSLALSFGLIVVGSAGRCGGYKVHAIVGGPLLVGGVGIIHVLIRYCVLHIISLRSQEETVK